MPVKYPELFWVDQYTHGTHKGAIIVGAKQRNF